MEVKFFPRNDVNVSVCNNRWNKSMTYCENSDTLEAGLYAPIILWAFRYNIKLGCFVSNNFNYLRDDENSVKLRKTGIIDYDYYYALQGGGTTQDGFNSFADNCREWFKSLYGKYPSCISYGGSDMSYSDLAAEKFIAGRSNNWNPFGNAYTWNGLSYPSKDKLGNPPDIIDRSREMLHLMSVRWCDEVHLNGYTVNDAITALIADVNITKNNHGFYNNFTHWHQLLGGGYSPVLPTDYRDYFAAINSDDIHFCSFGEAMEYAFIRSMIKKISCYIPKQNINKIRIIAEIENNFTPKVNLDCVNTPISISIDLSNTFLAGKNIKINKGTYIHDGVDKYIIDLFPSKRGNFFSVDIEEDTQDNSLNINNPVVNTIIDGNNISITIDQNCNLILFRRQNSVSESLATIVDYSYNVYSYQFAKESGYDYCVGCINDYKKTSLTGWF